MPTATVPPTPEPPCVGEECNPPATAAAAAARGKSSSGLCRRDLSRSRPADEGESPVGTLAKCITPMRVSISPLTTTRDVLRVPSSRCFADEGGSTKIQFSPVEIPDDFRPWYEQSGASETSHSTTRPLLRPRLRRDGQHTALVYDDTERQATRPVDRISAVLPSFDSQTFVRTWSYRTYFASIAPS